MVARLVRDQEVVGSSPVASTKNRRTPQGVRLFFAFGERLEGGAHYAWVHARSATKSSFPFPYSSCATTPCRNLRQIPVASTKNRRTPQGVRLFFAFGKRLEEGTRYPWVHARSATKSSFPFPLLVLRDDALPQPAADSRCLFKKFFIFA